MQRDAGQVTVWDLTGEYETVDESRDKLKHLQSMRRPQDSAACQEG